MSLTLLLGVSSDILKEHRKLAQKEKFFIQSNILLKDIKGIMDEGLAFVQDPATMDMLFLLPFDINHQQSELNISITFSSANTKLNINRLHPDDVNSSSYQYFYDTIEYLLIEENVADYSYFMTLLLDTLDGDKTERIYGSEIALEEPFFKNGSIDDWEQFERILEQYATEREDRSIYEIEWREMIDFHSKKIDLNYISPKLLSALLPGYSQTDIALLSDEKEAVFTSYEELNLADESIEKLKAIGIEPFVPILDCSVQIGHFGNRMQAEFFYYIEEKKITDVKTRYF